MRPRSERRQGTQGSSPPTPVGARSRVRTPCLLQMQAAECGAVCLGIVLAHFGRWVTLEELRLSCGVSRNGSRAVNLVRAAEGFGLRVSAFRCEPAALRRLGAPMIVHWAFNHFVVVEGFDERHVFINDPAVGHCTKGHDEFEASFTGVVLTFEAGPAFEKGGRPPSILRALVGHLAGTRRGLAAAIILGLALAVTRSSVTTLPKRFVDDVLYRRDPSSGVAILGGMAVAALALAALTWLQQESLLRVETRLASAGSRRLIWHVLHLPTEFFFQRFAGDIASRMYIPWRVSALVAREGAASVLSVALAAVMVTAMLRMDATLTAIALLAACFDALALRYFSRGSSECNRLLQQEKGKLQAAVTDGIDRIETVQATGGASDLHARWVGQQAKVVALRQALERQNVFLEAVPPLVGILSTGGVLGVGSLRVMSGAMTVGDLIAFQALLAAVLTPLARLMGLGARLQMAHADVHRLDDVLRHPVQLRRSRSDGATRTSAPSAGLIGLSGVSFGYDRSAPPLIRDVCVTLSRGKRVVAVGASGSGKSTVAQLLSGVLEPWGGQLWTSTAELETAGRNESVSTVAFVDQAIVLFEGTVRDNLTLWDGRVAEADLIEAARDAEVYEEIMARPGSWSSAVERDGRNWSGGQRQRLEIARALVGRPAVLVLDEATSALDPEMEARIYSNLHRRGCACFVVAHRISALLDADEILVLEKGQIVDRGSHIELIERSTRYRELLAHDE